MRFIGVMPCSAGTGRTLAACTSNLARSLPLGFTAADNEIGADNPVCHSFDLSTCGQSGGLCSGAPGGWLPPPTLQCPAAQRGCPEG